MSNNFSIPPAHHQWIDRVNLGTLNNNVKVRSMEDKQLEEQLQALFAEGKAFPHKQKVIKNKIGRLLDRNKYSLAKSRAYSLGFDDGWFLLMEHFWKNVWEIELGSKTESAYCDSEKIINRLRLVLRFKIIEAEEKIGARQKIEKSLDAPIGDGDGYTLLDQQAASTKTNDYEELKQAVEEDVMGVFFGAKMKSQPHINARTALQLYFQLEDWTKVAKELGVSENNISSFNSFYAGKIEPLISKFWGLLELVDLDITGELQRTLMEDYPQINAQKVLQKKLRGQRASYIADKLGVAETKLLTAFINDKCLPLLNGLRN